MANLKGARKRGLPFWQAYGKLQAIFPAPAGADPQSYIPHHTNK
ncbi:MAG TPA: hypothetical protein VFR24_21845 [Candidatus Angelobacter sp.]|nr:hypothetical protein [Candidatus Angelobacter sp.]